MKTASLLLILLSLSAASGHATQLYKWVDEKGQTQFSQFAPTNKQQAQQVKIETPKSIQAEASKEKLSNMRQKLLENSVGRNVQAEKDKEEEKKAEAYAEACKTAKKRLTHLKNNGRIYKTLENGDRKWYDIEGRAELIKSATGDVTKYCK